MISSVSPASSGHVSTPMHKLYVVATIRNLALTTEGIDLSSVLCLLSSAIAAIMITNCVECCLVGGLC